MARGSNDYSSNPLATKNILGAVKLIHSWPEHLSIHLTLSQPALFKDYFIQKCIPYYPAYNTHPIDNTHPLPKSLSHM